MPVQSLPDILRFDSETDTFRIEFDRRVGHYDSINHYHIEHEIYFLFRGNRKYFIKDSIYHVHSGDLMIIDSNAVHKTSDLGEPNHERIVVYFDPSYFAGYREDEKTLLLAPFTQVNKLVRLNLQERLYVEALLVSLLTEVNERPAGYHLRIRSMVEEFLLLTARHVLKRKAQSQNEFFSAVQRKVMDIVRHINIHYKEPLQLDILAKQFFISKSHLCRVFKEVTGFGFAEYVNTTRVKEAERLLRETEWSITQVSEHCGFENFSHFGKTFKKWTGLSPRSYRKLKHVEG